MARTYPTFNFRVFPSVPVRTMPEFHGWHDTVDPFEFKPERNMELEGAEADSFCSIPMFEIIGEYIFHTPTLNSLRMNRSAMSSSSELDALASAARHLLAGKYFQLASFVMLVYDHMITLDQEVNRIWNQKFSGATLLFLTNRYITPLQFIIILDAFNDLSWTKKKACQNFVVFEGASTAALIDICQPIDYDTEGLCSLSSLSHNPHLPDDPAGNANICFRNWPAYWIQSPTPMLTGCILTGSSSIFPSIWAAPLVTDNCIFLLTLWRTREFIRDSGRAPTLHIFVRDGILYFLAIFLANLMNTLLYFLAPSDLKAIGASFSQLLTAVMISRLVLNLRFAPTELEYYSGSSAFNVRRVIQDRSFLTRTIGNLGEDRIAFLLKPQRERNRISLW